MKDKILFIKAEIARQKAKRNAPRNGLSAELMAIFNDLSNRLSPENLNCDGEISRAEANRKYKQIMIEWAKAEKLAGRKVSEDEFPY